VRVLNARSRLSISGEKLKNLKSALVGIGLTVIASTLGLVPAGSASAATPKCTVRDLWGSSSSGVGFVWAPQSSSGTVKCGMKSGDNNKAVWALQDAIVHCYSINIGVDGDFGPQTVSALKTVQTRIGASADGEYGPQTAGLIKMRPDNEPAACGRL